MKGRILAICLLIFAFCLPTMAHEPLSVRIVKLTQQIKQDPNNPNLYLKRGELHRLSRDWQAAQDDYDRAQRLNPQLFEVEYCRGRMWLEAGQPERAKKALDRFLELNPDRDDALLARARAFEKMKDYRSSIVDYTRAIGMAQRAKPDHYIERAKAQVAAGLMDEALHGLDEAILKLGQLVTLQLQAIEIELRKQNWDAAIARLDKIAAQSTRKETYLAQRGEILIKAGRKDESRQAFRSALEAIEALAPRFRQTHAMIELEKRMRASLL